MRKFWIRMMSVLSMIAMLLCASTPVYAARDLVAIGTGSTTVTSTTTTASGSGSQSSGSAASTAANTSVTTATGTNQKSATTSTTAVQTGVVDDAIPFVLLIAAAMVMMVVLIRANINRRRYGNYGEYWMDQMIEYEKKMQAK